jgi:hypothetical protein
MPFKMVKRRGGYTVSSPNSVHGKHMTEKNAKSQIKLLNAVEHNPEFAAILRKGKGKSSVARPKS